MSEDSKKGVVAKIRSLLVSELFGNAGWLVSGGALQAGVAFLANLALVRLLTPEDFGRFAIIRADVSLVGALLNFRPGPLLLQAPDEELEPYNLSRYTGALIAETILVSLGSVVTLWFFDLLTAGALILLATSVAATWVTAEVKLYEREFNYTRLTIVESVGHIVSQIFAVLGAYFGLGSLVLYLRNTIRQTTIFEGLRRVGGLRGLPTRWLSIDDWVAYFERLKGFWADGLLERSYDRIVVLLVGTLAGEETTGYFYQARRLAITPNQILKPFSHRLAFNYFSHRVSFDQRYRVLQYGLASGGLMLAFVGFGVYVFADPIIPWVFGSGWGPVVPFLQAMVGVVIGMPLFGTLKAYFMAQNRMRPFMVWGRGTQYATIALVTIAVSASLVDAGYGLSIGLSASFGLGAFVMWAITHWENKDDE
jgi:O-antigen/teichoic acid export membrane protein